MLPGSVKDPPQVFVDEPVVGDPGVDSRMRMHVFELLDGVTERVPDEGLEAIHERVELGPLHPHCGELLLQLSEHLQRR